MKARRRRTGTMTAPTGARHMRPGPFRLLAVLAALAILATSAGAAAHSYKLGDIAIGHVWAPPTDGAGEAAVYGPILNRGDATVRLVGATTPIAETVRFRVARDGDTQWLDAIAFTPGKPLALAPWRVHIWLTGLRRPLKAGESFDLTLDFGPAGTVTVTVEVAPASGH